VLRLTPLPEPLVTDGEREPFRRLVVGLFGFRRKQLRRGLRELAGWDAGRVGAVLRGVGLDPTARPETVSPRAYAALLRALVDGGWAGR
jgi:16S rRNA A1518/A1519 N6-dimethyltransferase RsmA/KsgA/DIM1 with predicted DNA glycosylase/AP lyase activity